MAVAVRRRTGSELVQAVCLATDDVRDVVRISGPVVPNLPLRKCLLAMVRIIKHRFAAWRR